MINNELLESLKDLYPLVQVTPSVLPQLQKAEASIFRAEVALNKSSIERAAARIRLYQEKIDMLDAKVARLQTALTDVRDRAVLDSVMLKVINEALK